MTIAKPTPGNTISKIDEIIDTINAGGGGGADLTDYHNPTIALTADTGDLSLEADTTLSLAGTTTHITSGSTTTVNGPAIVIAGTFSTTIDAPTVNITTSSPGDINITSFNAVGITSGNGDATLRAGAGHSAYLNGDDANTSVVCDVDGIHGSVGPTHAIDFTGGEILLTTNTALGAIILQANDTVELITVEDDATITITNSGILGEINVTSATVNFFTTGGLFNNGVPIVGTPPFTAADAREVLTVSATNQKTEIVVNIVSFDGGTFDVTVDGTPVTIPFDTSQGPQQVVKGVTNPTVTGGTFDLTIDSTVMPGIPWNTDQGPLFTTITAAIPALIGVIAVFGDGPSDANYTFQFADGKPYTVTFDPTNLTGPDAPYAELTNYTSKANTAGYIRKAIPALNTVITSTEDLFSQITLTFLDAVAHPVTANGDNLTGPDAPYNLSVVPLQTAVTPSIVWAAPAILEGAIGQSNIIVVPPATQIDLTFDTFSQSTSPDLALNSDVQSIDVLTNGLYQFTVYLQLQAADAMTKSRILAMVPVVAGSNFASYPFLAGPINTVLMDGQVSGDPNTALNMTTTGYLQAGDSIRYTLSNQDPSVEQTVGTYMVIAQRIL